MIKLRRETRSLKGSLWSTIFEGHHRKRIRQLVSEGKPQPNPRSALWRLASLKLIKQRGWLPNLLGWGGSLDFNPSKLINLLVASIELIATFGASKQRHEGNPETPDLCWSSRQLHQSCHGRVGLPDPQQRLRGLLKRF